MVHGRLVLSFVVSIVVVLGSLPGSAVLAGEQMKFRASWNPDRVVPGAVVPVRVKSPVDLARAEAVTGAGRYPLIPLPDRTWLALVGVGDRFDEPLLPVVVELYTGRTGEPYRLEARLKLPARPPPRGSQSLNVPSRMVDYSDEELERVIQDSRQARAARDRSERRRFWSRGFIRPVKGRISTPFGVGRILNGRRRSPHNGIDIAADAGTPVKAGNAGAVVLATGMYLSGNTVMIDHGWGVFTIYAHMESFSVKPGQVVRRGETIGHVGSTGRSTGPHLHFGVYLRGARVDPLQLIDATAPIGGQAAAHR